MGQRRLRGRAWHEASSTVCRPPKTAVDLAIVMAYRKVAIMVEETIKDMENTRGAAVIERAKRLHGDKLYRFRRNAILIYIGFALTAVGLAYAGLKLWGIFYSP